MLLIGRIQNVRLCPASVQQKRPIRTKMKQKKCMHPKYYAESFKCEMLYNACINALAFFSLSKNICLIWHIARRWQIFHICNFILNNNNMFEITHTLIHTEIFCINKFIMRAVTTSAKIRHWPVFFSVVKLMPSIIKKDSMEQKMESLSLKIRV